MRAIIICLIAVGGAITVRADSVTYIVTPEAGEYAYAFVLTNTGATGGTLFDLFLSIPLDVTDIDTSTIGTPVGWGDPTGGLLFYGPNVSPSASFIEWADDSSGLYDVGIHDSLSAFSFASSQQVAGPIGFALNGSITVDVATPISSVPEPSRLASYLTFLLIFRRIAARNAMA
jgi:hypothetical protein